VIYRVPTNFAGVGRRVYPGFMQHTGFVAMNPSNHAKSHYDYFQDLIKGDGASTEAHRKFYDEYNAVLDMDADYYLETIKVVFQEFNLVNGTWDIKNVDGQIERVRPQDITTTALFSVEGELDDISGSGQTEAVHNICSGVVDSEQKHLIVEGAGHYGIFAGRRWREVVYPAVKAFILTHQPEVKEAKEVKAPVPEAKAVATPVAAAVTPTPVKAPVAKAKPVATPLAAKPVSAPVAMVKPIASAIQTTMVPVPAKAPLADTTPSQLTAVQEKPAVAQPSKLAANTIAKKVVRKK
jgi:poly(3-hydroxybutyrate) depolymerase